MNVPYGLVDALFGRWRGSFEPRNHGSKGYFFFDISEIDSFPTQNPPHPWWALMERSLVFDWWKFPTLTSWGFSLWVTED